MAVYYSSRFKMSGQIAASSMIAWVPAGPHGCEHGGLRYQRVLHEANKAFSSRMFSLPVQKYLSLPHIANG
jgi:hypothetical protein